MGFSFEFLILTHFPFYGTSNTACSYSCIHGEYGWLILKTLYPKQRLIRTFLCSFTILRGALLMCLFLFNIFIFYFMVKECVLYHKFINLHSFVTSDIPSMPCFVLHCQQKNIQFFHYNTFILIISK